jgi:hypothetical protein
VLWPLLLVRLSGASEPASQPTQRSTKATELQLPSDMQMKRQSWKASTPTAAAATPRPPPPPLPPPLQLYPVRSRIYREGGTRITYPHPQHFSFLLLYIIMILFLFYSLIPFFPFFFVFFIFLSKLGAEQKQCETRRRKTSTSIYRKELLTVRTRIPFLSLLNRRPFCLLRARYSVPVILILRPHTAQFRVDSIDIFFYFFFLHMVRPESKKVEWCV